MRNRRLFLAVLVIMTVSVSAQKYRFGNIGVGVNKKTAVSLLNSKFNIALFGNVDTLNGVQASVFTSVARGEMKGVNFGMLSALTRGKASGLQVAGFVNGVDGDMRGVQWAGVSNIAKHVNGLQMAGFTNASATPMRGVQLAGLTNVSMGVEKGLQLASVANVSSSYMRGAQFAIYNFADTLNGSQFGLFNACNSHPRGVQVGIINYSRDTVAHKIGLVNVNPKTRIDMLLYGGTSTKGNIGVRFRNRSTYNILGVGTHFMGLDETFSAALF